MPETLYSFPKRLRVTKSTEYKRLSQKGRRVYGNSFVADCLQGTNKQSTARPRLGITVSKKYGKAHERNRFKRLVKEAFRLNQHLLPSSLVINIRPSNRTQGPLTLEAVAHDLKRLFIAKKEIESALPEQNSVLITSS